MCSGARLMVCILCCIQYFVCVCVRVVCVCGSALHYAGGQNTRDCFDLDSLCLVQSQSCRQLPAAAATHSWCRAEALLPVTTLYTLHFLPERRAREMDGAILHSADGQKESQRRCQRRAAQPDLFRSRAFVVRRAV